MSATIASVNVSAARTVEHQGKAVTTAIFKRPVAGRVPVRGVNLQGDDQADRAVHGGPDRALYAYALEDYRWWSEQLGRALHPGTFGENLTTTGIDVGGALIGERWGAGSVELQVTAPRVPCSKLAMAMDDPAFVHAFSQAARPGAYLSIVTEGDVAAGDELRILSRPAHGLTVAAMFRIYLFDRARLDELLVPELPASWREWVLQQR